MVGIEAGPFREENGTLYRPGESFAPYVSPAQVLSTGELSKQKRLHVLQNRIHYALGDYLNGGTPHSLEVAASILEAEGIAVASDDPLDLITTYYAHAAALKPDPQTTEEVSMGRFRSEDYAENELEGELQAFVDAVRGLDEYLAGAYLHGSFGDQTYVQNYSDVDVLLIVADDALRSRSALQRLRREIQELKVYYYYVDPHQHHGTMIGAEPDLDAYNRAYLPPVALSRGKSLLGSPRIRFHVRDDELERHHGFWRVLQTLRRSVQDDRFPASFNGRHLSAEQEGPLYCLKHFTSLVLLLPSLYATARGIPTYKADSFDLDVLEEGGVSKEIVRRCSAIRDQYPHAVSFQRGAEYRAALAKTPDRARREYNDAEVPEEIWTLLGRDYFDAALRTAEQLWNDVR